MSDQLYARFKSEHFLIAGPCVMEEEKMVLDVAEKLTAACLKRDLLFVFKASFDKANRTSADSFRGPGLEKGLKILEKVKKSTGALITTDIHESHQAKPVGEIVDIIQIPAFLCRQTDLLVEAGKTGKIVNIKKAQFIAGKDMVYPVNKVESTGNKNILLTERGSFYGFNSLVVDFTQVVDMMELGYPVVMDATHSTQKPGGLGNMTGGNRKYSIYLAKAARGVGVKGFFFEVHPDPGHALSDGPNMIKLDDFIKNHLPVVSS
jgi:2-dehydro-3-deoxyphosphooctonate aldolase (KDO 8-P synthase)